MSALTLNQRQHWLALSAKDPASLTKRERGQLRFYRGEPETFEDVEHMTLCDLDSERWELIRTGLINLHGFDIRKIEGAVQVFELDGWEKATMRATDTVADAFAMAKFIYEMTDF